MDAVVAQLERVCELEVARTERAGHAVELAREVDSGAVVGAIAVLAHLATAWRDEGVGDLGVLAVHAFALGAVAVAANLVRAFEDRRTPT